MKWFPSALLLMLPLAASALAHVLTGNTSVRRWSGSSKGGTCLCRVHRESAFAYQLLDTPREMIDRMCCYDSFGGDLWREGVSLQTIERGR